MNQHLVYTHGYGVGRVAARTAVDDGAAVVPRCRDIPPQAELQPVDPSSPASTSARHCRATSSSVRKVAEQRADARAARREETQYNGKAGVDVVELRAQARARAAVRRLEPARLGPAHRRVARPATSATSATASRRPRRSCASTPTRTRWSSTEASLWVLDGYTTSDRTRTRSRSTRATCPTAAGSTPTSTTCATR